MYYNYVCDIYLIVVSISDSRKSWIVDFYVFVVAYYDYYDLYFSSSNSSRYSYIKDFDLNKSMYPESICSVSTLHLALKFDKIEPDNLL